MCRKVEDLPVNVRQNQFCLFTACAEVSLRANIVSRALCVVLPLRVWTGEEKGTPHGEGETTAELAQKILQAIRALHKPVEDGEGGENNSGKCVLCCSSTSEDDGGDIGDVGDDGDLGDRGSGACGCDDALALSTGLCAVSEGTDISDGEKQCR